MIKKIKDKDIDPNSYKDSGFSAKPNSSGVRLLNKDGRFNTKKIGLPFFDRFSLFHSLHQLSWMKFMLVIFTFYFLVNLIFSFVYYWIGVEGISGAVFTSEYDKFWQAFYFSCQTITTVGFGALSPNTNTIQLVSSLESFIGLLLFALMTGMLYGRFSKPKAQFIFSDSILVAPYQNGKALMFRLANAKNTDMIDAEVQFMMAYVEDGIRKFSDFDLERRNVKFFPTSWTVVHPITEDSVVWNWTEEDFKTKDVEFLTAIKAYDNTYDQEVNSRTSYKYDEMVWNEKFVSALKFDKSGNTFLDLSLVGAHQKVSDENS